MTDKPDLDAIEAQLKEDGFLWPPDAEDLTAALRAAWDSERASEQLHKQWHDRALKAEKALAFYANHIHWMGLTSDSETETVLIAMGESKNHHGWSVAEEALKP